MKFIWVIVMIVFLAAVANLIFYLWFTRRLFGKVVFEKTPENGHFVFKIPEKNFQYSIPMSDYERSRNEPVPVPGTDMIFLYRGRIYDNLENAAEEMAKRAGKEAARTFLARRGRDIRKMPGEE